MHTSPTPASPVAPLRDAFGLIVIPVREWSPAIEVIDLDSGEWFRMDEPTMAAIQTGRAPSSNTGGASHA